MKQTAVEWLIEQMLEQGYFDGNKPLTFTNLDHLQQQAKAMEKEQIISVYWDAYNEGKYSTDKTAEEYYKENFKQD
jgi:HEPN domain-containing protein